MGDTYVFHRKVELRTIFPRINGHNAVKAYYANLRICKGRKTFMRASIPCRARLYKLIVAFYLRNSFGSDTWTSITEEDFAYIKNALFFRKKYNVWRRCFKIKEKKGTEEARIFFETKGKLFGMLLMMEGDKRTRARMLRLS